jgi:hypothetical protein
LEVAKLEVGQEQRHHVDEIAPQLHDIIAVGDGTIAVPWYMGQGVGCLGKGGMVVDGLSGGDAEGAGVAGCTWENVRVLAL